MSKNSTQDGLLRAIFTGYFSEITDVEITNKGVVLGDKEYTLKEYDTQIDAFDLIQEQTYGTDRFSLDRKNTFVEADLWEGAVEEILSIIRHPAPQNRSSSDECFENTELEANNHVVYYDEQHNVRSEPRGLLSLSVKNDNSVHPITKHDVLYFIRCVAHDTALDLKTKREKLLIRLVAEKIADLDSQHSLAMVETMKLSKDIKLMSPGQREKYTKKITELRELVTLDIAYESPGIIDQINNQLTDLSEQINNELADPSEQINNRNEEIPENNEIEPQDILTFASCTCLAIAAAIGIGAIGIGASHIYNKL